MKTYYFTLIGILFSAASWASPFYPAHVQVCRANIENSGQGIAYEMIINYEEDQKGLNSCQVAYYYGHEYGSNTGFRGMFTIYPLSTTGLECVVSKKLTIDVKKKNKKNQYDILVSDCLLKKGGDI